MFHGWTDVVSGDAVGGESAAIVGFDVDNNFVSRWGKRRGVEVKHSPDLSVCRKFGVKTRRPEEVEGDDGPVNECF